MDLPNARSVVNALNQGRLAGMVLFFVILEHDPAIIPMPTPCITQRETDERARNSQLG
jgi:hypothetical protein